MPTVAADPPPTLWFTELPGVASPTRSSRGTRLFQANPNQGANSQLKFATPERPGLPAFRVSVSLSTLAPDPSGASFWPKVAFELWQRLLNALHVADAEEHR